MLCLKKLIIREKGATHPCQIPQKNPAGFETVYVPSPGMQPVNATRINTVKKHKNNTRFFK